MSDFTNYNNIDSDKNQNLDFKPNKTENTKGFLFILSIIFFGLGFMISCLNAFIKFKKQSNIDVAYASGYASGIIIVNILIIVGLFLLSTRVFKKKVVLLIFSIIFLLGSFLALIVTTQTSLKESKMNKAAQDKLISICNNLAAGKDISGENLDKSVYGDMTPLLNLMKDYGTKFHKLSTNISNDISAADFENLLAPDTLSSTVKINNAKKKLEVSIKLFDKYETEYNDLITNFDTSVSTMKLPKSFKSDFLDAFRKGQIESRDNTSKFFKVERDICSKCNNLMDFMLSIEGNYTVQGNQILLETDDDLNKYNRYINEIKKLAQKEADIQNSINESLKLKLDKLNKYK